MAIGHGNPPASILFSNYPIQGQFALVCLRKLAKEEIIMFEEEMYGV